MIQNNSLIQGMRGPGTAAPAAPGTSMANVLAHQAATGSSAFGRMAESNGGVHGPGSGVGTMTGATDPQVPQGPQLGGFSQGQPRAPSDVPQVPAMSSFSPTALRQFNMARTTGMTVGTSGIHGPGGGIGTMTGYASPAAPSGPQASGFVAGHRSDPAAGGSAFAPNLNAGGSAFAPNPGGVGSAFHGHAPQSPILRALMGGRPPVQQPNHSELLAGVLGRRG